MGPVRADHRRKGQPLRAYRAHGVALVGVEQDLLGRRVWACARRTASTHPYVDVPSLPDRPRPRPQRRRGHSRRRAGGETKRLWSPCKTATGCGHGCRSRKHPNSGVAARESPPFTAGSTSSKHLPRPSITMSFQGVAGAGDSADRSAYRVSVPSADRQSNPRAELDVSTRLPAGLSGRKSKHIGNERCSSTTWTAAGPGRRGQSHRSAQPSSPPPIVARRASGETPANLGRLTRST